LVAYGKDIANMDKQPPNPPANIFPADTPVRQASQKRDKTGAARAKAYRKRKKQQFRSATAAAAEPSLERLVPPNVMSTDGAEETSALVPAVTPRESSESVLLNRRIKPANRLSIAPSRQFLASVLLTTAALALSAVGIAINGWFARSLGSSDLAGWLFLAVGVAADLAALVLPYTAASLWHTGQRAAALVGWVVWFVTFMFAVTAGVGFASSNIADVTLVRASRVTPAITSDQAMLTDAMTARDRECKGGVGKFCREREALVAERRQLLNGAMTSVHQAADPQTDAAIKLLAWISAGMMRPAREDFFMFRLILFALLPQIGGLLLLVGRHARNSGTNSPGINALASAPTVTWK
jgi:hypothetical protein